jgi:drug/metabolite transporter, DME family
MSTSANSPSPTQARLYVLAAALLWSTSGAFTKVLTQNTVFGLNEPRIEGFAVQGFAEPLPLQIAFYRAVFAGLLLVPSLKLRSLTVRGSMIVMGIFFVIMNVTFLSAMALGTAANAILLQYSAPLWVYLAGILWLGEKPQARSTIAMWLGMAGIGIIVAGGWHEGELPVMALGLISGVAYGGVLVCIRLLRDVSAPWLTVWNHLWGALALLPIVAFLTPPTASQLFVLIAYGTLQMGFPYWMLAKGLRSISPQEAGTITLLEPLLNPVWAYLVSPETETPNTFTLIGGSVILATLAWRYWPRKDATENQPV